MYSNWLMNTNTIINQNVNSINYTVNAMDNFVERITPTQVNNSNHLNATMMSQPTDVILEIGLRPSNARFIAHSIVLGSYSGYLRSALRLDERPPNPKTDLVVYLNNVTPEQFAPLLTYMYTGYLDLNLENIFAVLLATHVLHMPQALEICRSFLLQAQCDGYLPPVGINDISGNGFSNYSFSSSQRKIVRPIASKPSVGNYFFSPLTHSAGHSLLSSTPLLNQMQCATTTTLSSALADSTKHNRGIQPEELMETVQTQDCLNSRPAEDDEDEEVFIDTSSSDLDMIEMDIKKFSGKKNPLSVQPSTAISTNKNNIKILHRSVIKIHGSDIISRKSEINRELNKQHRNKYRRKSMSSSVSTGIELQTARAPVQSSQLDTNNPNKVIIDIASCDGPVRFKRILNSSYNYKPNVNYNYPTHSTTNKYLSEKAQQNVSISFQQQMARTISKKCQQMQKTEESENSETSSNCSNKLNASSYKALRHELYICVYCKHTFKSQYCYEKHAKRHLNPIGVQNSNTLESQSLETRNTNCRITNTKKLSPMLCAGGRKRSSITIIKSSNSPTSGQRNETNPLPLDMNVQYYPCKTCGSKFPSYYFVHKHRKMCHADEESLAAGNQDLKDVANPIAITDDNTINGSKPTTTNISNDDNCEAID